MFSHQGGRPGQCDQIVAHQLLDQYIAAGGNFIDTADVYQHGMSERIIGQYLVKRPELRSKLIIATKVSMNYLGLHSGTSQMWIIVLCIIVGLHNGMSQMWIIVLCIYPIKSGLHNGMSQMWIVHIVEQLPHSSWDSIIDLFCVANDQSSIMGQNDVVLCVYRV